MLIEKPTAQKLAAGRASLKCNAAVLLADHKACPVPQGQFLIKKGLNPHERKRE